MRIGIVYDVEDNCGVSIYTKKLISELKKKVKVNEIRLKSKMSSDYYKKMAQRANQNDLVHIQFDYPYFGKKLISGVYAPLFYEEINKPIVTTIHDLENYDKKSLKGAIIEKLRKMIERTVLIKSNAIIAEHKIIKKKIAGKAEKKKITVIPFPETKLKKIQKDRAKKLLKLEGKKILCIFGFISDQKDYSTVLNVLSDLNENYFLIIAGEEKNKNKLKIRKIKEEIMKKKLKNKVMFTGFVSEKKMPILFSAVDLFVLPYKSLTQSAVINLIISNNNKALASNLDYFKEMKKKYENMDCYSKENQLKAKIKKLMKKKISYSRKENEYKISTIVNKHLQVYKKVMSFN